MKHTSLIALAVLYLVAQCGYAAQKPTSFAYVLQADAFAANKTLAVKQLAKCDRDWIILDATFSSAEPWTNVDLDALRNGRPDRKILAYISIGEAEDYRAYWRKEWSSKGRLTPAAPKWLGAENPDWKGNYQVKYWNPDWQKIMLAVVGKTMESGFDGIYLDIVDGFETFEKNGMRYIDDRINPETKQSYRRDMIEFVITIATHARSANPTALVIPQNGSQLLQHADFTAAISAIGIEDLFTDDNKLQPKSHTAEVLSHLKVMTAAQKPVLLTEYPKSAKLRALSKKLAQENGLIWLITDRELTTLGASQRSTSSDSLAD